MNENPNFMCKIQITLKDILSRYWGETILIFAGWLYSRKRELVLPRKEIEQKQVLFEENGNNILKRFRESYVKLQGIHRHLCQPGFNFKDTTNEQFNRSIIDCMEELYSSYFYLRLYFEPLEQAPYADLESEMRIISFKIVEISERLPELNGSSLQEELKRLIERNLKLIMRILK
jgi:hypothetical protein